MGADAPATHQECAEIAEVLNVDIEDIQAALDEEESSRIELQDGYTLILVDIPTVEIRHENRVTRQFRSVSF